MKTRSLFALFLCAALIPMSACDNAPQPPAVVQPASQKTPPKSVEPSTQSPGVKADSNKAALNKEDTMALVPVLSGYLDVQEALANTKHDVAIEHAKALKLNLGKVILTKRSSNKWKAMSAAFNSHTDALAQSKDIKAARLAFVPLTSDMQGFLETFGNVTDKPVRKAFCPMAMESKGGTWFQRAEVVDNTYYGDEMRQCGEIQKVVNPTEKLI